MLNNKISIEVGDYIFKLKKNYKNVARTPYLHSLNVGGHS